MYIIVDKKTNAIIHMFNSIPERGKRPEEIYPFDRVSMAFGSSPEQSTPRSGSPSRMSVKDLTSVATPTVENLA
jgi:hypothetical protein